MKRNLYVISGVTGMTGNEVARQLVHKFLFRELTESLPNKKPCSSNNSASSLILFFILLSLIYICTVRTCESPNKPVHHTDRQNR